MANYQLEQTGAEVQALLNAVESPDTTPAAGSSNLITSGAVQAAVAGVSAEVTELGQKVGVDVSENGWFLVDALFNVAMKYDADGLDVAKVSAHFKSLLGGFFEVIESGIYFVDEQMNIGAKLTTDGFFAKNLMSYEII
jgi:hypothetical protein